jgi:hypothetical protein
VVEDQFRRIFADMGIPDVAFLPARTANSMPPVGPGMKYLLAQPFLNDTARARDERGAPRVIADVRATDTGTGSCGHDPASRTGILVARRQDGPGMLVTDIAASGVRP